ncbi:MAG TPA: sodium:proton antiporter [Tepidisphaeraceae bacterium]|jgi:NhaP-type Na+/H+ or K+/H+ antiporter
MALNILEQLTLILVLGIAAQWVAWSLRFPAILLLLLTGLAIGPGTKWLVQIGRMQHPLLDPNTLFGDLLLPVISMFVAIILFEGGLTLDFREIASTRAVVLKLVSIGAIVTGVLIVLSARFILHVQWPIAVLVGAILVVTGPTVIGPLLRHVRPIGPTGPILRWEGIIIDPIGALLALLVFAGIPLHGALGGLTWLITISVLKTVVFGLLCGLSGAAVLMLAFRRFLVPDYLQNAVTLMFLLAAFTGANTLQSESGLFAAAAMGILLANQRYVTITHISEFKESLSVLLLSMLFIVIAARLDTAQLARIRWDHLIFIGVLIIIVRPLSVTISTLGSSLSWRERVFLCCMAPRGVVAASVSSIFALRLAERGYADARELLPIVFSVIIGTVAVYGMAAGPIARKLGLAKPEKLGFLIAGANALAIAVGVALRDAGYEVLVADTNRSNIDTARRAGLPTYYGSISSRHLLDRVELSGIGRLLALTSNEAVNAIASLHFARHFGRSEIYQLAPANAEGSHREKVASHFTGRYLFHKNFTYEELLKQLRSGKTLELIKLEKDPQPEDLEKISPLFVTNSAGMMNVVTTDSPPAAKAGDSLIYLKEPAAK